MGVYVCVACMLVSEVELGEGKEVERSVLGRRLVSGVGWVDPCRGSPRAYTSVSNYLLWARGNEKSWFARGPRPKIASKHEIIYM